MEATLSSAFGEVVKKLRKTAGISQEQLGFKANLQRKHISNLELGRKEPTLLTLFRIAVALDISPEQFVKLVVEELKTTKHCPQ